MYVLGNRDWPIALQDDVVAFGRHRPSIGFAQLFEPACPFLPLRLGQLPVCRRALRAGSGCGKEKREGESTVDWETGHVRDGRGY